MIDSGLCISTQEGLFPLMQVKDGAIFRASLSQRFTFGRCKIKYPTSFIEDTENIIVERYLVGGQTFRPSTPAHKHAPSVSDASPVFDYSQPQVEILANAEGFIKH